MSSDKMKDINTENLIMEKHTKFDPSVEEYEQRLHQQDQEIRQLRSLVLVEKTKCERYQKKIQYIQDNQDIFTKLKSAYFTLKLSEQNREHEKKDFSTQISDAKRDPQLCIPAEYVNANPEFCKGLCAVNKQELNDIKSLIKNMREFVDSNQQRLVKQSKAQKFRKTDLCKKMSNLYDENQLLKERLEQSTREINKLKDSTGGDTKENIVLRKLCVKLATNVLPKKSPSGESIESILSAKETKLIDVLVKKYDEKKIKSAKEYPSNSDIKSSSGYNTNTNYESSTALNKEYESSIGLKTNTNYESSTGFKSAAGSESDIHTDFKSHTYIKSKHNYKSHTRTDEETSNYNRNDPPKLQPNYNKERNYGNNQNEINETNSFRPSRNEPRIYRPSQNDNYRPPQNESNSYVPNSSQSNANYVTNEEVNNPNYHNYSLNKHVNTKYISNQNYPSNTRAQSHTSNIGNTQNPNVRYTTPSHTPKMCHSPNQNYAPNYDSSHGYELNPSYPPNYVPNPNYESTTRGSYTPNSNYESISSINYIPTPNSNYESNPNSYYTSNSEYTYNSNPNYISNSNSYYQHYDQTYDQNSGDQNQYESNESNQKYRSYPTYGQDEYNNSSSTTDFESTTDLKFKNAPFLTTIKESSDEHLNKKQTKNFTNPSQSYVDYRSKSARGEFKEENVIPLRRSRSAHSRDKLYSIEDFKMVQDITMRKEESLRGTTHRSGFLTARSNGSIQTIENADTYRSALEVISDNEI